MYIFKVIKSIYKTLNREQKAKMLLIQIFFAFSALVQVIGVASIAPFIGIVSNPESVQKNEVLATIYRMGKFESNQEFIIGFALLSIAMIVISNAMSAITLWIQLKFSVYLGNSIQFQLYEKFINQNYLFHKSTNYNQPISIISADAPRFIYMVLQPYLTLCSQIFIATIILLGLVFINPAIAFGSALLMGGAYLGTYWIIKKSLKKHGEIVTYRNRAIQALLSESFIGIKDIKLNSMESQYTNRYASINKRGLDSNAYIVLSGDLPRFAIETISFSAILLFAILLLSQNSSSESVVSILSFYAIAGYKLLPTMQQIYKSISSMSANGAVSIELKRSLDAVVDKKPDQKVLPLDSVNEISLNNIKYKYPNTEKVAINNISLQFFKGELNTIAGPSGSGKSTLADIILGLLSPTAGFITVDNQPIEANVLLSYQHSIGYVPQNIFILDDTVIANIAFGIAPKEVDLVKVKQALTEANALEFVEKLPLGMDTQLGQDGKLLSGGQRQRIGIARALYRRNKILILDEPTSALDIDSEHDLMQLLNKLKKNVLIIVISHRPAAIKLSDKIILISEGEVIADGNFTCLYNENSYFRSMIEKGFMN
jgi:ABC-type multidrug transport system fused ATPase/permease subunit